MKLKSLLFALCFCLIGHVVAGNTHLHAKADQKSMPKGTMYPEYCEIEIINASYTSVYVLGTFDDYSTIGFNVYPFDTQYISLYYPDIYGKWFCHSGMNIQITSPYREIYNDWTYVNETLRIIPFMNNDLKAEVSKK